MNKLINHIKNRDLVLARKYFIEIKNTISDRDRLFFEALIFQLEKNNKDAIINYKKVLEKIPSDLASLVNLASIYNASGEYLESNKILEPQIQKYGKYNNFAFSLFDCKFGLNEYLEAELILDKIEENENIAVKERRAALYLQKNEVEKSISLLESIPEEICELRPQIYGNLSAAYNRLANYEKSLFYINKALNINSEIWQFSLNKSNCLLSMERKKEAKDILDSLIKKGIRTPVVLGNLARLESQNGNFQKSNEYCAEALTKSPKESSVLCCHADNLIMLEKYDEAFEEYKKSIAINPFDDLTNWHYSMALLRTENYIKGWEQYKWGFKRKKAGRGNYKFNIENEWNGIDGVDKLIIWGEQGIGDELMFSKFIKYIDDRVAEVELRIDHRLVSSFRKRLITRSNVTIVPHSDKENSKHIPIGNLPSICWDSYINDLNATAPYFKRLIIRKEKKLRIGIAWRGGQSERMQNRRSIPLGVFKRIELLKRDDIQIVMLQYNPLEEEIQLLSSLFSTKLSLPNYDAKIEVDKWIDHIDSCDFIISVDNSAIHFSGALGIPTLAIIPEIADFRWGLKKKDNVWYESVQLFRNGGLLNLDFISNYINEWINSKIKEK